MYIYNMPNADWTDQSEYIFLFMYYIDTYLFKMILYELCVIYL